MRHPRLKRKHPDFQTCVLPVLKISGVSFERAPGTVSWGPKDPHADPDQPAQARGDLYTHTALPGLLLKNVSGPEELFRLGSSFVLFQKTMSNSGSVVCFMGRSAENVLLTGMMPITPRDLQDIVPAVVPNGKGAVSRLPRAGKWKAGLTGVIIEGAPITGKYEAYATGVNGMRSNCSNESSAVSTGHANIYSAANAYNLNAAPATNDGGGWVIMAVLTNAEDGFLQANVYGTGMTSNADLNRPYCYGFATVPVFLGKTLKQVALAYRDAFLAEVPSDGRDVAAKAFAIEYNTAIDYDLEITAGVGWHFTCPNSSTTIYTRDVGLMVPSNGIACSRRPFYGSSRLEDFRMAPCDIVPCSDFDAKATSQILATCCFATTGVIDGKPTYPAYVPSHAMEDRTAVDIRSVVEQRAASFTSAFTDADLQTQSDAGGTVINPGPSQYVVGSVDKDFTVFSKSQYAIMCDDINTHMPVQQMSEFFRRVARRADRIARS